MYEPEGPSLEIIEILGILWISHIPCLPLAETITILEIRRILRNFAQNRPRTRNGESGCSEPPDSPRPQGM
jgi:hypothetical protein